MEATHAFSASVAEGWYLEVSAAAGFDAVRAHIKDKYVEELRDRGFLVANTLQVHPDALCRKRPHKDSYRLPKFLFLYLARIH